MAAEGEQPRLVALDERLERAVVAPPDEGDELLVALQPAGANARLVRAEPAPCVESGGFQGWVPARCTTR